MKKGTPGAVAIQESIKPAKALSAVCAMLLISAQNAIKKKSLLLCARPTCDVCFDSGKRAFHEVARDFPTKTDYAHVEPSACGM
jgi:hypothetical protein